MVRRTDVPEANIEKLFNSLHFARALASLLARNTMDLPVSDGGASLDSTDLQLSEPTEIRMFGIWLRLNLLPYDITRLLRDAASFSETITRSRACQWLISQDHDGKNYRDILEGFVSAGSRCGDSEGDVRDSMVFLRSVLPSITKDGIEGGSSIIIGMSWRQRGV
jgi:hypothetical protein